MSPGVAAHQNQARHLQVEAMPPAATAHALLCRDALLAITERVLTRSK